VAAAALLLLIGAVSDTAEARGRKKRSAGGYNPPYAAIVVDANSGQLLHASNADSLRHPASLTKIMTLYLLFEQIEAGKFKLDSELDVSSHGASMAPSKLGLRPGSTISVEDAIKALVTKSANDVAATIGENIAGDEEEFAKLMTRKARALGMSRTVYTNASGLPDPDQVTTARDQATLGRAIQDRFPRLYRYFSTHTFYFRGRGIRNHNRLLGQVAGVDGIKTGYIRASGFNLVTSMRRNDRHVVAVVMGGASGASRDARMRQLLEGYITEASTRRTTPKVLEASAPKEFELAARSDEVTERPEPVRGKPRLAAVDTSARIEPITTATIPPMVSAPLRVSPPVLGSNEPIKPVAVKTVAVKRAAVQAGMLPSAPASTAVAAPVSETLALQQPAPRPGVLGVLPARASGEVALARIAAAGEAMPVLAAASEPAVSSSRASGRGDWMIQVGAFPDQSQAQERLKAAQSHAKMVLGAAEPFTERVVKGQSTLYRARFAGFDKDSAETACKHLKRNDIACLALKN
jgi:D-alanyl-D-alanine carboxypeptidase